MVPHGSLACLLRQLPRAAAAAWLLLATLASAQPAPVELVGFPPAAIPAAKTASEASVKLPDEVTPEAIQQRIEQLKTSTEGDAATRGRLLELYQQTASELERAKALAARAAEFDQAVLEAPRLLQEIRAQLDAPLVPPRPHIPPSDTLAPWESALAEAQAALAVAQKELTELEAEPKRRADRRLEIPKQLEAVTRQLEEVEKLLAAPAGDEPKETAAARRLFLLARKAALEKELHVYKRERESYDVRNELLPKRRDLAEREVAQKKALVDAWQKLIHDRRQLEAAEKLRQAVRDQSLADPALRGLADENAQLARLVKEIEAKATRAGQQTAQFTNLLPELKREFQGITQKVDFGLTQELGPFLLQYRGELRSRKHQVARAQLPPATIAQVQMEWMDLLDQRRKLGDLEARAEELVDQVARSGSRVPREALEAEIRDLLRQRREILDALNSAYERYFRELAELSFMEKQLVEEIAAQTEYINQRILWVRSAPPLGAGDLTLAWEAIVWSTRPDEWVGGTRRFFRHLLLEPIGALAAAALLAPLLAGQCRLRRRLRALGEQAARGSCDKLRPTIQALVLSLLAAAPWPLLVGLIAWRLPAASPDSELSRALAGGLQWSAVLFFPVEFLRQVCRRRGLGEAHFGWPELSMKLLRGRLRTLLLCGLPLSIVGGTMHFQENDQFRDSLGRVLFMLGMVLLALFLQRVLRPVGGLLHEFIAYRRGGWVDRLLLVGFPLGVGAPLALSLLAGLGYYYTARQLAWRLHATTCLVVGCLLVGALLLRWVLVIRRRLAIEQLRQRRAAAQNEPRVAEISSSIPLPAEPEVDLSAINVQTRRLLHAALVIGLLAGVWLIWSEVLPALSILNKPLWQTTVEVTEAVTTADGTPVLHTLQRQEPVNLAHLLVALLVATMTLIAGRNMPGLLEIALLQRLPLEPATRYAITTLSRYSITIVGVVLTAAMLGVGWAKVQWLVAAVSVGLGFGLQEIFANFVSGLIILFERPVRVGDIVTIGDTSGVVSRIRIRATTITNWDRKELIVPNKEFITGRLLNWTLSDAVNRVRIDVGVAYGSDVARVRELLLEIARDNPRVMEDPPPLATFEGFGDSALNFVLRCFLTSLENRLEVVHALHAAIHDRFREEQIEIAFPQRDLHIRTLGPLLPVVGLAPSHSV